MIYVFLAPGFEETEAITPIDLLRRCELDVQIVGVGSAIIKGSHNIPVFADIEENEIVLDENLQMIVLPGGMPGTLNLEASKKVQEAVEFCINNSIPIGAICAAPTILGHKGYLNGKNAVCYQGFESQLLGSNVLFDSICEDGNIITARGAGVSVQFGLKLVEKLISKERSEILGASLLCEKNK